MAQTFLAGIVDSSVGIAPAWFFKFVLVQPKFISNFPSHSPFWFFILIFLVSVHTWATRAAFGLLSDGILAISGGAGTCCANLWAIWACARLAGIVWVGPGLTALVRVTFGSCAGAVFSVFCENSGMDGCILKKNCLNLAFINHKLQILFTRFCGAICTCNQSDQSPIS